MGSRTRVGVEDEKRAQRGMPSIDSQLPISSLRYTEETRIDTFHVSDFGAFDQSYRLENVVDLSGNSIYNSLKVSSRKISPSPVHIGTLDKLLTSLDKNPLTNQTEPHRLQFQQEKVQSSNPVTILVGNTENQEEPAMADGSPRTDISTDADTDDKNQRFDRSQALVGAASDSSDRTREKTDQKSLRRLAQNREAARKSRLRKKLESSRLKLTQLEQELQRARQQGVFISSSGDQAHSMSGNGAMQFDAEYARWLEEQNRQINELRAAVNSHASDTELRMVIDSILAHYDEIFRLKGIAAKADVFHLLSGMWKTPAERCFLWLGGFRSSEVLKVSFC
ncbi:unnamed protein product [Lupinus luteus]|uniref:DOG1 domain-containing protein n=1 Tax=Lupinus luteus TaxID=3873 RepID=A0AAV1YL16_LUPLU